VTEFELFQALRPLYPAAEYALLPQVANSTGAGNKRHCDALALSLWPSRGLHLSGFEMKSYRGDWLRELRNPEKGEEIAAKVNYWWVVASNLAVVGPGELPQGWGLLAWDEKLAKLAKIKAAPFREADKLDLAFIAAALRQAQGVCTPAGVIADARKAGYDEGVRQTKEDLKYDRHDYDVLDTAVKDFEKASGIKIRHRWEGGKEIGKAVAEVLAGTLANRRRALVEIAQLILKEFGDEDAEQA
jgi:hypothetical protein